MKKLSTQSGISKIFQGFIKVFRNLNGPADGKVSTSKRWHSENIKTVFESLETTADGLSKEEIKNRLVRHGPNRLQEEKKRGPLIRFFSQFHNVLIYVLLAASIVTAILGHWVDTGVILGVVFLNAMIGFIQEGKAEDALKAIRQMLSLNAIVVRDGHQVTVQADSLVPGDIVLLQSAGAPELVTLTPAALP